MKNSSAKLGSIILSFAVMTIANGEPQKAPQAPSMFDNGPLPLTIIDLSASETLGIALFESIMHIAETVIHVNSCQLTAGVYSIEVSTNGSGKSPQTNNIKLFSPENTEPLALTASLNPPDDFRGQTITIKQHNNGKLKETLISGYSGEFNINKESNLAVIESHLNVSGLNNGLITFQNSSIKNFYQEQKSTNSTHYLLNWGLESLSAEGYPENTYWNQSKFLKVDRHLKRVLLSNSRLIGASACRILIESASVEPKKDDALFHKGTLTISESTPKSELPKSSEF
ncbi:MAG: hypothetical protein KGZ88_00050 [Methylomicrobium sp.]|nr:hypothetical protein [Methylomicrobium sp.]